MASPICAEDYQALARTRLTDEVWDFLDGGAGDEVTLAANLRAFQEVTLHPRVLVDVSRISTATTLLGCPLPDPVAIAPMAYQRLLHPDGEVGTARGATGSLFVVSIFASQTLEEIAAAATGPLWLQVYWLSRRDALAALVARAADAGYRAIVLTVDAPRIGERRRDRRNGFAVDPSVAAVNVDAALMRATHERQPGRSALAEHAELTFDQGITWADLAWLRGRTELPLVLKGVLTGADAALAVEHGVDALIVSNHGGRQLDRTPASLDVLPEVVRAVGGAGPVLLDGGVRTGADVFAALGLGASAVLVGRPAGWALAADGADGVARLMALLRGELAHTMALAGRPALADIDRDAVGRRPGTGR